MLEPVTHLDEELSARHPSEERRAALRYRSTTTSSCRPAGTSFTVQAGVRDVSNYGIGLLLTEPIELSTLLELDLIQPNGKLLRTVLARVVHVECWSEDEWLIGCAFTAELSDAELKLFHAERVRPPAGDGRRWVRFPCNVETVCYTWVTAPGEQCAARILNISAGGIGLLLPCQFEGGTLLLFKVPGSPAQAPQSMLVRVVRCIEQDNGDWFLGCEFVEKLSDDEVRALL